VLEPWFRRRTDIEERFREAKLGAGRNHLPSGHADVNKVWMWAALLAGALSVMLQTLTGISETRGTARMSRLRHELLALRARVISHASQTTLRQPTGHELLPHVLVKIRALPPPA